MFGRQPDRHEANLDRIQVIKGWLDTDGKTQEKIYDVALSDSRSDGAQKVGNTVDLKTGTYTNDIGAPELVAVWSDPDFDPGLRAFYYVRVIQIPTPRHSLYDAIALGIDPAETKHLTTIQERAYSSPIWYTPDASVAIAVPKLAFADRRGITVDQLIKDGFKQLTGQEICNELLGKTLVLRDLNSGREYEGILLEGGQRMMKETTIEGARQSADALFHGSGPVLVGEAAYEIKDNAIVSTDGMRTIKSMLYRQGSRIVAARDVDDGVVNYELRIK